MKTRDEGNCEGVCSLRDLNRTTQRDKGRTQIDHRGNIKSGNQDEVSRNKRARTWLSVSQQRVTYDHCGRVASGRRKPEEVAERQMHESGMVKIEML